MRVYLEGCSRESDTKLMLNENYRQICGCINLTKGIFFDFTYFFPFWFGEIMHTKPQKRREKKLKYR